MTRRAARAAALLGVAAVAGCDDGTVITRVDNLIGATQPYIAPMAAGGLPVEVHGAPFAGVTPAEVAGRLRLPGQWPADIRFRALGPQDPAVGRLVLAFNRDGPPDGYADCRGAPVRTRPPAETGFTVTASFCNGARLLTTGHMEARKTRADDPDGFARAMTRLFDATLSATRGGAR